MAHKLTIWIAEFKVDTSVNAVYSNEDPYNAQPPDINVHQSVPDATQICLVVPGPLEGWHRTTLGEIRAWLQEKADALARAATSSPGTKADAETRGTAPDTFAPPTDAAVPGLSIGETIPPDPRVTPAVTPAPETPGVNDTTTGGLQTQLIGDAPLDDDIPF